MERSEVSIMAKIAKVRSQKLHVNTEDKEATRLKPHEMGLLQLWLAALFHPSRAFEELKRKPAPRWGLYATLLRILFILLAWYLPLYLLGMKPSPPSYLTFVPTENYYAASMIIFPLYNLAIWLLFSALVHIILRLGGWKSDIDQILNIGGVAGLIFQPVISLLDWTGVVLGWHSLPVVLGITHLVIDFWVIVWIAKGYNKILGLPTWLGAGLTLLVTIVNVPLAMLFLRG
jgi:Yip1-like protein